MFITLARKFKNVPNSENYQLLLQIMQVLLPRMSHTSNRFFLLQYLFNLLDI
jgi:hypothetical protein